MSAEEKHAAQQRAQQDLDDIRALRNNEPFNRYWLRRLKDKRASAETRFRHDPPEKCSPEERETLRRLLDSYDELLALMQVDERAATAQMQRG